MISPGPQGLRDSVSSPSGPQGLRDCQFSIRAARAPGLCQFSILLTSDGPTLPVLILIVQEVLIVLLLYMCVMRVGECAHGHRRTTFRNWFSPSILNCRNNLHLGLRKPREEVRLRLYTSKGWDIQGWGPRDREAHGEMLLA